jgi:ATP-dependent Clp protease ATP-binding subunit ClpA
MTETAQNSTVNGTTSSIGTGHILLALVKEGSGVGANVLQNLGIELGIVRRDALECIGRGEEEVAGRLTPNSEAEKVVEYAIEEAKNLNVNLRQIQVGRGTEGVRGTADGSGGR